MLDDNLPKFFHEYRVSRKKKKQLPKRNTVEAIRSHLKLRFQRHNENLDISTEAEFPKFNLFWKGFIKTLKAKGKGDTTHNPELPKEHLQKINELLVLLHEIMIGKSCIIDETKQPPVKTTNKSYSKLLEKVPEMYDKKGKHNFFFK